MSFRDYFGIEDSILPRLASGFGGGIGRKGSLCGAFTGSIMAIGMKMGRTDPKDKKTISKAYDTCRRFWDKFEREFGSTLCCDLTGGYHLDDEEERQKWLASGGMEKCAALVEKTAGMLCGFVQGAK